MPQAPELQKWIQYNNSTIYHATLSYFVPRIRLHFIGEQTSFSFYTDSVQEGTYIRSMSDEDRAFLKWLESLSGENNSQWWADD